MRILFVVSDLSFPSTDGQSQQTLLLVRSLVESGDDVSVMGFLRESESVDIAGLSEYLSIDKLGPFAEYRGSVLGLAIRNALPAWISRGEAARFRHQMSTATADVIHLDGVAAASLYRPESAGPTVASLIDPGSRRQYRFARMDRASRQTPLHLLASFLFFAIERRLAGPWLTWHVVSEADRDYLQRMHRDARVVAVPVMVPAVLVPPERVSAELIDDGPPLVLVYADLRRKDMRRAFLDLFAKAMPLSSLAPTCRFVVLGRVRADAELLDGTRDYDCRFIQWVEDYVELMSRCDVVILPDVIGTGIKNRAVQSLALGRPTIGTVAAFEGIDLPGPDVARVARSDVEMAFHLDQLCASSDLREQISAKAADFAGAHYSQTAIVQRWHDLYEDAIEQR